MLVWKINNNTRIISVFRILTTVNLLLLTPVYITFALKHTQMLHTCTHTCTHIHTDINRYRHGYVTWVSPTVLLRAFIFTEYGNALVIKSSPSYVTMTCPAGK